jgi:YesN/AraC family two-component response regulator
MGESRKDALRVNFDRKLKLEFHGVKVTSVRIERAKRLLLATNQNCNEICFQVGYNNQSYFTRTFKDLVGIPPRQFRALNKRKSKISRPM